MTEIETIATTRGPLVEDDSVEAIMVKPLDNKTFVETIGIIEHYWGLSRLPNGG
jgi:hypothetical protein